MHFHISKFFSWQESNCINKKWKLSSKYLAKYIGAANIKIFPPMLFYIILNALWYTTLQYTTLCYATTSDTMMWHLTNLKSMTLLIPYYDIIWCHTMTLNTTLWQFDAMLHHFLIQWYVNLWCTNLFVNYNIVHHKILSISHIVQY